MFMEMELASQFATGAAAGLGHSFGQRFLPWIVKAWSRLRGGDSAAASQNSAMLPRRVSLEDLAKGVPEGFELCRFRGQTLVERNLLEPPAKIGPQEALWLVPTGPVWLTAPIAIDAGSAKAEVAVEFDPQAGLSSLLSADQDLDSHWLEALVAGGMTGVLAAVGKTGAQSLLAGDSNMAHECTVRLDHALRDRGLRCRGLRTVRENDRVVASDDSPPSSTPSTFVTLQGNETAEMAQLAAELAQVHKPADWNQLVQGLQSVGVPVDATAAKQLDAMGDEVLAKSLSPQQGLTRLAQLTTEAFERAGVEEPDLRRWQTISDRLADEAAESETVDRSMAAVGVATHKRPSTWFVWSRQEVDRRQLSYTRRTVRSCRAACDQALANLRNMPALRQVRDLNTQLQMIEEWLETMPPLQIRTASLRIDSATTKSLLRSLAEAVTATESLATQTEKLFLQEPTSTQWQEAMSTCLRSASKLAQFIRDRRSVR